MSDEKTTIAIEETEDQKSIIKEMIAAKVCFGHKSSVTHPKMKPFIVGVKNTQTIIDLEKTMEGLEKARAFFNQLVKAGKTILFLDTNPLTRDITKEAAQKSKSFYLINRWIGGFLTNFPVISKRLEYFRNLKEKNSQGELLKYPKKEQMKFQKEITDLAEMFYGVEDCQKMPEALMVVNIRRHQTAAREARRKNIPMIAIVDTDSDPTAADYPIFGNDHFRSSVQYLLNQLISGIINENQS